MTARTALFVAAFDSQLKWCAGLRDDLAARGFVCRVVVPDTRSALSPGQIADAGFDEVRHVTWSELVAEAGRSDVVVSALAGPTTRRLTIELTLDPPPAPGPVVVTGWVGLVIEKAVAGYLDRSGCDVVAVNSTHDLGVFRHAADALGLPHDNLLLSGLPYVPTGVGPARPGPVRTVLMADQPTVPASPADRLHLYRRLAAHARTHPDREVLLKPRHRPDEDTFHVMRHHPEDLLRGEDLPANLRIVYTPVSELLPRTDLLLTVSSTAALEALGAGCRVAFVLDLGVHEQHGNQVFLDSGLLRTFDQIDVDDLGEVDARWLAAHVTAGRRPAGRTVGDRVEHLLATGERPGAAVRSSPYGRGAVALHVARSTHDAEPRGGAWPTRVRRHGPVAGTARHLAAVALPPAVGRAVRRAAASRRRRRLRAGDGVVRAAR